MAEPETASEPELREQQCESCLAVVRFYEVKTPDGMPDVIRPVNPEAWFGWAFADRDDMLTLITLCSRRCLDDWAMGDGHPGA